MNYKPLGGSLGLLLVGWLALAAWTPASPAPVGRPTAPDGEPARLASAAFADGPDAPMYIPILLTISPSTVVGGQSVQCTVTFSDVSSSDRVVAIQTDHPEVFADLPSSVVVVAGTKSKSFSVQTNTVTSSVTARVTATYDADWSQASVTVTP
jgi:hypothetical protein